MGTPPALTTMFAMRWAILALFAAGAAAQSLRGNLTTLTISEDILNETDVKDPSSKTAAAQLQLGAAWMLNTSDGTDSDIKNVSLQSALGYATGQQCCKAGWSCGGCGSWTCHLNPGCFFCTCDCCAAEKYNR